jgi:uncharacterized repeat protein (TIGR03803 family)
MKTTLYDGRRTCGMTKRVGGRKPALALFMRLILGAVVVVPAFGVQAGVVFNTLYSFGSIMDTNGTPLDGANPVAGLVQGNDGYLYGTTQAGGTNGGYGTVFIISTFGTLTSLYSFTGTNDGANPLAGLVQGSDGYFYGTTCFGGTNEAGTVFKITKNGVLTSLYSFNYTNDDGGRPRAGLVQASDGNLYGTTWSAPFGPGKWGTFFRISTNGTLTTLWDCNPYIAFGGGIQPYAGLVQGSDGYLYGTTELDGASDGAVVRLSITDNNNALPNTLYSFGTAYNGANPVAGLVQGSDGSFYGTTGYGGTNNSGTVFQVTTNRELTSLHSFSGTNDGAHPLAGLVQGENGTLYGTTCDGGSSGNGTLFAINTNGTGFRTLYSFSASGTNSSGVYTNSDGTNPKAGLILSGNTLYGTASGGGSSGNGTVFSLSFPPQLTLTPSGANVILTWPTNYAGFTLEFATNLVPPVAWNANVWNANPMVSVAGSQNVVTNPISGSQMFFRLATAQNFASNWLGLRYTMKAAGAISYGHQHCYTGGPFVTYDMFYLPVPTHVVELANANPALCFESISSSSGPSPGYGCPQQWGGLVGPQSIGPIVIVLPGSQTGNSCDTDGPYQGF